MPCEVASFLERLHCRLFWRESKETPIYPIERKPKPSHRSAEGKMTMMSFAPAKRQENHHPEEKGSERERVDDAQGLAQAMIAQENALHLSAPSLSCRSRRSRIASAPALRRECCYRSPEAVEVEGVSDSLWSLVRGFAWVVFSAPVIGNALFASGADLSWSVHHTPTTIKQTPSAR